MTPETNESETTPTTLKAAQVGQHCLVRSRELLESARNGYAEAIKKAFPVGSTVESRYWSKERRLFKIVGYSRSLNEGVVMAVSVDGGKDVSIHEQETILISLPNAESSHARREPTTDSNGND